MHSQDLPSATASLAPRTVSSALTRRLGALLTAPLILLACSASPGSGIEGEGSKETGTDTLGSGLGTPGELQPGQEAAATPNCADGVLDDDETCDDGNSDNNDGCWGNCRGIDPGFICPAAGSLCLPFAKCGDGQTTFPEQCDDANSETPGCSASCKLELGYKCPPNEDGLSVCSPTTCGDDIVEGAEMCEPNLNAGCTSQCQFAPKCDGNGSCTSECGDGLVLGEACDDGNKLGGDGCSPSCEVELGYECPAQEADCERTEAGDCILRIPVAYRDFAYSHPDFQEGSCSGSVATPDLVNATLTGGKPTPKGNTAGQCISQLGQWYTDGTHATTFHSELVLYDDGAGNFVNRYGANGEKWETEGGGGRIAGLYDGSPFFFPVDGIPGAKDDGGETAQVSTTEYGMTGGLINDPSGAYRNFSFTSEVTYWFPYDAGTNATLKFTGDDDLWVFVAGKLALDLGGLHQAVPGEFTISGGNPNIIGGTAAAHGMTPGGVYEIKVFHAERKSKGSTFKLTLSGFNTRRSDCIAKCGDGIIAFGEECDDGVNDGGYNECQAECKLGGYCGDGIKQEGETCDDKDPEAPADCSGCRITVIK